MTDEQFEQLLAALSNSADIWITVAVALLSAAAGFGLALIQSAIARRNARRDATSAERRQASQEAAAWAYRLCSCSPAEVTPMMKRFMDEGSEVRVRLSGLEENDRDLVGSWLLRRMQMLLDQPADGRLIWTEDEIQSRTRIAIEVSKGLRAWARGEKPETEYDSRLDVRWFAYGGYDVTEAELRDRFVAE